MVGTVARRGIGAYPQEKHQGRIIFAVGRLVLLRGEDSARENEHRLRMRLPLYLFVRFCVL
jgi:hypothetical protein